MRVSYGRVVSTDIHTPKSSADIYTRKSSADGGKSVAQQDDECADGITERGWTIGRRFTDDNRSASRYATKKREDYEALLSHIEAGGCEILAMWETARGGRREVTYFQLLELCRDRGTKIYIYTHDRLYDLRRRSDWRSLAQEVIDSADYSSKLSEASQRGKRQIAMAGKPAGRLNYGYVREYHPRTGAYVRQLEHPEQAPALRRMADELLAGRSTSAIARDLNADGIPTATGSQWRGVDVARVLVNPVYVGLRVHKGEVLPEVNADWPQILDKGDWLKCRAILGDPARLKHRGIEPRWMLSGVAECHYEKDCGGVLRSHTVKGVRRYACRSCWRVSVTADDLDRCITDVVKRRLRRPDAADLFRPRVDSAAARTAEAAERELELELKTYVDLAKARKISAVSFAEIEAGLLPQLEQARARKRALSAPPPLPELEGVDVAAVWESLPVMTQRAVIQMLMRVRLRPAPARGARFTPERVEITWKS
jgi:site-specific DNA recombinase